MSYNNNDTIISVSSLNESNTYIHSDNSNIEPYNNIVIQDIDLMIAKEDKKDLLISSLLKYIYNIETKYNKNNYSFNNFLKMISNTGLIRQNILNSKYDGIRNKVLNNMIKSIKMYNNNLLDNPDWINTISPKFENTLLSNIIDDKNIYKSFRLIRQINTGGYGTIYEIHSLIDNKSYALKKTKYNHISNNKWNNEVTIMSTLRHNNIICYHSSWIDYDIINRYDNNIYLYIQMELCDIDLSKLLNMYNLENRKEYIYDIIKQIFLGVRYLHTNNIVHRDLKPSNILIKLIGDDIKIKITDYGCSKIIKDEIIDKKIDCYTENKLILPRLPSSDCIGTVLYTAPEIENKRHYDYSSDIYSLGLILFEIVTDIPDIADKINKFKNINQYLNSQNNPVYEIVSSMISDNINNRPNINELISIWGKKKFKNMFKC